MTAYYAMTYLYQNDVEYRCSWDLCCDIKGEPTDEELIAHLWDMLSENYESTWNTFDDDLVVNLHGLSPKEFARELVLNFESAQERGLVSDYEINTNWDEVGDGDYDHPCNL